MKRPLLLCGILMASGSLLLGYAGAEPCVAPDNGTETIDFPPNCPYDNPGEPMMIIDGLPPGTTIELHGPLTEFTNVVNQPGGILGGEICTFDAWFAWEVVGTGDLTGFLRTVWMPVSGEIHIGPRNPGDQVQSFSAEIIHLVGELFGDPDFCTFRVFAGLDLGLPGPGQTTLTELPSGDFAVDSFFDISYQIFFEGCPGSQLADLAGTTTHMVRRFTEVYVELPCCWAPDNGSGTIDYPPDCPHDGLGDPMLIVDGLPPGTTIELRGPLTDFTNVSNQSGGTLGGEICAFDAVFDWDMVGTGELTGFSRHISMPVAGEFHIGPRSPGDPLQIFTTDLFDLSGELFGDPDFCTFRIFAGTDNGLPSPGHAVLTELPNGDFAVDSFFDITYRIEFEGCPASQLEDLAGTTTHAVRRVTCNTYEVDWCRLQWPTTFEDYPGRPVTVFGRLYIDGLTDWTSGNDPAPGIVIGQVGHGASGSDPSANPESWTWFPAVPNHAWNDASEPGNDEYMANLVTPSIPGGYDYAYRFSGDGGENWTYADRDTGVPGEDGSENGYQPDNAGKMTVWPPPCCVSPDNGAGTIDFPPACPYDYPPEPMLIIDGLPPGSTIELHGPLRDISNVINVLGGTLGGEICTFDAVFEWDVVGTGDLAGFNRHIWMPVSGEFHTGTHTPGDPAQLFPIDLFRLQGELFGDPDFCMIRVFAGTDYGLPSPGQTLLVEMPGGGDFNVDSFFDISYRIEFEGCPASQLEDLAGATTHTVTRATCDEPATDVDDRFNEVLATKIYLASNTPNPFTVSTDIGYVIPSSAAGSCVVLNVYDAAGRRIRILIDAPQAAGLHTVRWDGLDQSGRRVSAGIYFYRLKMGQEYQSRRMLLLR